MTQLSAAFFAATASHTTKASTGSSSSFFILLVVLVVVFWFAIIRPQKNRQRQQQQTMSALQPGDEVVTVGGLVATVVETADDRVVLSVSPGSSGGSGDQVPVEMTFLRQAISRKLTAEPQSGAGSTEAEDGEEDDGEGGQEEDAEEDEPR